MTYKYLRIMRQNRQSDTTEPVVFRDVTWLNGNHSVDKCWQLKDAANPEPLAHTPGLKVNQGQGGQFIIIHAGTSDGFVPNALLTFKAKSKSGDYHSSEMNGENFKKWLQEKLLRNMPPGAIIVVDNAPYHSVLAEKIPTMPS